MQTNCVRTLWVMCRINAPGEQAAVFNQSSSTITVTKSNKSWYCRRLHKSRHSEQMIKWTDLAICSCIGLWIHIIT